MRTHSWIVAAMLVAASLPAQAQPSRAREAQREARERAREARRAAQQAANQQTETFSRTVPLQANGRVTVQNISGHIDITTGSRPEVVISAVKRTPGPRSELSRVQIEVDAARDRVDVRTVYQDRGRSENNRVSVDYTVTVPASAAVELKSVSGDLKVTGVQGSVFAEAISGDIVTTGTPRVEVAKSVSGDVEIADVSTDRALSAETISGHLRGSNIKARELVMKTVSGEIVVSDATADRVTAHSVSGSVEYNGSISRGGSYDFNSHSGPIRLTIPENSGFRLTASTFSGNISSDLPLTLGGTRGGQVIVGGRGRGRRGPNGNGSIQATAGDGSASIEIHSFSSDVTISKR